MFENYTFDAIMDDVLEGIPSEYDKREGGIIYDALAPAVIEVAVIYQMLDEMLKDCFGSTATREYLILRALERGIVPHVATKAVLKLKTLPISAEIPIGTRFSHEMYYYTITECLGKGIYKAECDEKGTIGNRYLGSLVAVSHVPGLTSAAVTEVLIPGENEEETEDFRKRYLDSFESEAFGGNIDDYKEKINQIVGVGGVKVFPHTNADDEQIPMNVKLVIINSDNTVPSDELVKEVQKQVDPLENSGNGVGIAPIGHFCHVRGVEAYKPKITFKITYVKGYEWKDIEEAYNKMLDTYFMELNKKWADSKEGIMLQRAQVESRILNLEGVYDVSVVMIDGQTSNKQLTLNQILVRG